ncbi:MAG TPA: hypothetical protein VLT35_01315, partial [Methanocella sp.]|nr:hypothetical protein [Methanocella sp.]
VLDVKGKKLRGAVSLKRAAVQAGLGRMGKNTLLGNDRYGNMLWLGGVLTTAELGADPVAAYGGCIPGCLLCLDACPVKALDGVSIDQRACGRHAFGEERVLFRGHGGWRIKCNACCRVCPSATGIRPRASGGRPRPFPAMRSKMGNLQGSSFAMLPSIGPVRETAS